MPTASTRTVSAHAATRYRFHDFILSGGDMPLMLLERRVDAWIAAEKARV